jgi:hypothetical protein
MTACVGDAEHVIDCAALEPGFSCHAPEVSGVPRVVCGVAAECAPGDVQEPTCMDATTMAVCNAGRVETVDCTELGFTGCETWGSTAFCGPFF